MYKFYLQLHYHLMSHLIINKQILILSCTSVTSGSGSLILFIIAFLFTVKIATTVDIAQR